MMGHERMELLRKEVGDLPQNPDNAISADDPETIERLFDVACRFYRRNESKAFHPSFDTRNQMNALMLQAKYGNYDDGRAPDIGVLDLVGKSRRNQWSLLKNMSKTEAMSKFIKILDEICPLFKAYAEAVKLSSEVKVESGPSNDNDKEPSALKKDDQLKAIYLSLCRQTHNQFKSYAEKQYPNDSTEQKNLIKSLQDQYYQQYISQMNLGTSANNKESNKLNGVHSPNSSPSPSTTETKTLSVDSITQNGDSSRTKPLQSHRELESATEDFQARSHEVPQVSSMSSLQPVKSSQMSLDDVSNEEINPSEPYSTGLANGTEWTEVNVSDPTPQNDISKSHELGQASEPSPTLKSQNHQYQSLEKINDIATFEAYPEPTPIKKVVDNKPKGMTMNLLSYFLDNQSDKKQEVKPTDDKTTQANQSESIYPVTPHEQLINRESISLREEPTVNGGDHILEMPEQEPDAEPVDEKTSNEEPRVIELWNSQSLDDSESPLQQSSTIYEPIKPASIWTKKGVIEFKDSLEGDKYGGSYVVNQSTLLIIQVPTYPGGRFIHWEFATDDYDIGFGLDFVFDDNLTQPLAIRIYEESDDEDEEPIGDDEVDLVKEIGIDQNEMLLRKQADKFARAMNTKPIIPTYRRDSHEEIFVGRHEYPGQGYYVLKFDNTYSVIRSKVLYFRICYFI